MSRPHFKKPLSHVGRGAQLGALHFEGDPQWKAPLGRACRPPSDYDERAATHGFHAWPARLHPSIAATLIPLAPAGLAIADPFMGGGTTPLEAMFAGRQAIGNDLNPIGLEVAWTRTRRNAPALMGRAKAFVKMALARAEQRPEPDFVRAVGDWFDPIALAEVWALRTVIMAAQETDTDRILRAVLSSILVKLSKQVSDSVTKIDRRQEKPERSPRGRTFEWFLGRAFELEEQLRETQRRLSMSCPEPLLRMGDARTAPDELPKLGAIISSPPYPGVYDYLRHHLLRCAVLGFDPGPAARHEIGARRSHEREGRELADRRYVEALAEVLTSWGKALVPQGFMALVIGDGQLGPDVIPVLPLLAQSAASSPLKISATMSDPRPTFAPGESGGTKTMKHEHLVVLTPR